MNKEDKIKILALYLPQYHEIPENNLWWGNGFTEWVNVKKAKSIFPWQNLPDRPLNDNYYNLLDKATVKWQTKLANDYGIYGFCYFHYYFKGKKLLEKPAENLLRWKDINQRFCFFWANVSWCRTWSAVKEATTNWVVNGEEQYQKNSDGMLMEQVYGDKEDWEDHFKYLLPFFKDSRYIKKDNKPMFFIYRIDLIEHASEMFAVWNDLAQKNGFDGVHIVSVNEEVPDVSGVEAIAHYGFERVTKSDYIYSGKCWLNKQLHCLFRFLRGQGWEYPFVFDYEKMWQMITKVKPYGNRPNYPGAFVGYDETPRKGYRSVCVKGKELTVFEKYMRKQLERTKNIYRSEYLLLDAWNEWGEGNYLEPDEKFEYGFLETLLKIQQIEK